jgi:hypothetical protein
MIMQAGTRRSERLARKRAAHETGVTTSEELTPSGGLRVSF